MKTRLALALLAGLALAADWPQWRGPDRNGVCKETGLLKEWPKEGPKLLWTYGDAGAGYSTPAVVGDRLLLSGARGDSEYVFALDLKTSPPKEVWAVKLGRKFTWAANKWNEGPSATPTVDGNLVFALGGFGDLVCVDARDGKEKWRKSLAEDLAGEVNPIGGGPEKLGWGYACAPLVDGDRLICVPGGPQGTLAALNKATGEVLWRSKGLTDQATYAAPVVADIAGVRQYIQMTNAGVASVGTDGGLLWYYKRKNPYGDIIGCTPVVSGNHVFISGAGSGGGSDLIKVEKAEGGLRAVKAAENRKLSNYHGGVVLVGDHIYGASGDFGRSRWVCLDVKTLKPAWDEEDRDLGKGAVTAADGCLYCLGEKDGLVKLLEASPKAMNTLSQFQLPNASKLRKDGGGFWTHPVIAEGKLYLRDQEFLYCYDVKGK